MSPTNVHRQPVGNPVDFAGARPPAPVTLTVLGGHDDRWTYQSVDAPRSLDDARAVVDGSPAPPSGTSWAVTDTTSGARLGRVCLRRADPANGTIEMGAIIYSPVLQRTRAATEVQDVAAEHVFDAVGYRRYEWKCDSLNLAMTDGDWPRVRAALRAWLDDDNHDEDGRQRRSLATMRAEQA